MVARVFTHFGRAHADDFLACSLILYKYPDAFVYRVPKLPELGDDDVAVDIGGVYKPCRILDHHHDLELPSSFVLVLQDFYGYSYDELPRSFVQLDLRDRFGWRKVSEKGGLFPSFVEEAVLAVFSKHSEIRPGSFMHSLLASIGEAAVSRIEELRYVRGNAVYRDFGDGLYVAFSPKPVSVELLKEATPSGGVLIGAVMPDSRDQGRTALIRVDDSQWFEPSAIPVDKSFIHRTGFYVVANIPFEKITPELVSKCVVI